MANRSNRMQPADNAAKDARKAMGSLIESRSLPIREDDPEYPKEVARLAHAIADAMAVERGRRPRGVR